MMTDDTNNFSDEVFASFDDLNDSNEVRVFCIKSLVIIQKQYDAKFDAESDAYIAGDAESLVERNREPTNKSRKRNSPGKRKRFNQPPISTEHTVTLEIFSIPKELIPNNSSTPTFDNNQTTFCNKCKNVYLPKPRHKTGDCIGTYRSYYCKWCGVVDNANGHVPLHNTENFQSFVRFERCPVYDASNNNASNTGSSKVTQNQSSTPVSSTFFQATGNQNAQPTLQFFPHNAPQMSTWNLQQNPLVHFSELSVDSYLDSNKF